MKRSDFRWLGFGFVVALIVATVAFAATTDQILRDVYDEANSALRTVNE